MVFGFLKYLTLCETEDATCEKANGAKRSFGGAKKFVVNTKFFFVKAEEKLRAYEESEKVGFFCARKWV